MASATENRFVNLYINGKQVGQTYQEIRRNATKLRQEIERGKLSQDEYNKKVGELRKYNAILQDHGDKIKGVNKNWGMLKSVMMGVVGGNLILGAFQKITQFIPNLINQNAKLADSYADVRKTTGLTEESLTELNLRLKSFDTRTSRSELLGLAREAGKLGIEGVTSIAGFVKAADQIQVSLGEDLGDGAITQLGKLNNLFKVSEIYGFEEGMLKLGSVINELGAASEASEGAIVDFLNRTNAAAIQAGVSYQDLAGIGSTLNSLGQQAETSGTAISQVFIKMGQDTEEFAKIAGVSTAEFSKLLKEDANEALLLFLAGINGNNQGLEVFAKKFAGLGLDGARAISIIGSLSGNIGKLREQQLLSNKAFKEGTSLTNEFNLKNNNLAGTLDKIGKRLGSIWINSDLVNGVGKMVTWFEKLIRLPVDQELQRQRVATLSLSSEIVKLNVGSQERIDKINQLKKEFPNILGHLKSETVGNRELLTAMQYVNAEYVKRILLARKQEELEDLGIDQADALIAENARQESANTQREKLLSDLNVKEKQLFLENETQIIDYYRRIQSSNGGHVAKQIKFQNAMDKLGIAGGIRSEDINSYNERLKEYEAARQRRIDIDNEFNKQMAQVNKIAGSFRETSSGAGQQLKPEQDTTESTSTASEDDTLDKEKEKYEKLLDLIRKEEEKLAIGRLEGRAKEEEEVRLHYEKLRDEAKGHAAEITLINELEKEALRGIDNKYGKEYDNERREAQQQIAKSLLSENERKLQAETDYWEELIAKAREYGLEYEELEEAHQSAVTELKRKQLAARTTDEEAAAAEQQRMYLESGAIIVGAIKDIADIQAKNAKFQANMALFQQLINAGLALSNAAASAKGVTPVDYLAGLAMVTVAIMARINQAKQLREQAGEAPEREFARGTLNYTGDHIAGDQGREIYRGAQITPADISQHILASNAFNRTLPQPNFSAINDGLTFTQGRQAQQSSVGGAGGTSMDLAPMLIKMDQLISETRRAQDKKIVLSQFDQDRFDERYQRNMKRVRMGG